MIRPAGFGSNPETAASNRFQQPHATAGGEARATAIQEFDAVVAALRSAGVAAHVLDEPSDIACPDAVFPNNWVSLHHDGTVVLYPMLAASRRLERRPELLARLEEHGGFTVTRLVDLTHHELSGRFLEGTGSVVFDHFGRLAYACRSPRTHPTVLAELCEELGYEPVVFDASDTAGVPVYHTNVLLSIGRRSAILCADAVERGQRAGLLERLRSSGRQVITIDHAQMAEFAGNVLELEDRDGLAVLAMSERACRSLGPRALELLGDSVHRIVTTPIPTIEELGGGSVRCMLAEVFLPRRLEHALVGAWQLVRWTIEYPATGRVTQPFGPRPKGQLVYTADGHMSAVMQKPDRSPLSRADVRAVSDAEKAAAFDGYLHYAGRWHVAGDCVVHDVDCAMNPNLLDTRQVRRASIAGDALELTAEETLETPEQMRRHRILWRRAASAA